MIKKSFGTLAAILIMIMLLAGTAFAGEQRVFDDAGLYSAEEAESLANQVDEFKKLSHMDMVIVTTESTGGKSASQYGEDFYIAGNYGTGDDYNGILLLIDMDNRELWIKTFGAMNRFITDRRVDTMLDHAMEGAVNGDYLASAQAFVKDSTTYYKKGVESGQYNYNEETGEISVYRSIRWYEALIALFVSLFTAFIPCKAVLSEYAMKQQRKQADNYLKAYRATSNFAFANQMDNLIDKKVSQMVIPRSTSSGGRPGGGMGGGSSAGRTTVHRSSGRSVGGGGRKF